MQVDNGTTWKENTVPIHHDQRQGGPILGFDFLDEHQVRWNWTTKTLEVDQEHIPCKMGDMTTKVHRIITQQLSIIPPNS